MEDHFITDKQTKSTMKNNKTKLGFTSIEYNMDGTILKAEFTSTMTINIKGGILQALINNVQGNNTDIETIQRNSDTALASYFNAINEIELRDIEKQRIVSEVKLCTYYDTNLVHKCKIDYFLEDI